MDQRDDYSNDKFYDDGWTCREVGGPGTQRAATVAAFLTPAAVRRRELPGQKRVLPMQGGKE